MEDLKEIDKHLISIEKILELIPGTKVKKHKNYNVFYFQYFHFKSH